MGERKETKVLGESVPFRSLSKATRTGTVVHTHTHTQPLGAHNSRSVALKCLACFGARTLRTAVHKTSYCGTLTQTSTTTICARRT